MHSELSYARVILRPIRKIDNRAWRRVREHFRDSEIAHLNGTKPNRLPLWILRRVLKTDSRREDRETFGIFHDDEYIGTIELYDIANDKCSLGIIIGERDYWGKGFGSEAVLALLGYAFYQLDLKQVYLRTYSDNKRALASFRKIGFREVRRMNSDEDRVSIHMKMTKEQYLRNINR